MADCAYADVGVCGDRPVGSDPAWVVFGEFPVITWRQMSAWRRRCARALDDLAGDFAAGLWPDPTCRAEEMATCT